MTSLQWGRVATCRELDFYASLVRIIEVSSANRGWWVPFVKGASFIYRLYNTRARAEPSGTLPLFLIWREFTVCLDFKYSVSEKRGNHLNKVLQKIVILTVYVVGQFTKFCQRLSRYQRMLQRSTYYFNVEILSNVTSPIHTLKNAAVIWPKPNWLAYSISRSSIRVAYVFRVFLKLLSQNNFPVDKRLTGPRT
jgi:hypothetical protein